MLRSIGLRPVSGSGSGWLEKEDGENEYILAQLKSTSAESYRVSLVDLDKLEYHASVSNKVPLFLVQFIECGRLYAIARIEDLQDLVQGLYAHDSKQVKQVKFSFDSDNLPIQKKVKTSTAKSRESFYESQSKTYCRGRRKR